MDMEAMLFFQKRPQALPIFEAFERKIRQAFPDAAMKVQKTQITFADGLGFAFAWLPPRNTGAVMGVSFGLSYRNEDARIYVAVEPYPDRWTHHVLVGRVEDIDGQLMAWIAESHAYAQLRGAKRKGKK